MAIFAQFSHIKNGLALIGLSFPIDPENGKFEIVEMLAHVNNKHFRVKTRKINKIFLVQLWQILYIVFTKKKYQLVLIF